MTYHDPAAIREALSAHKREGTPWARAWLLTAGPEPPVARGASAGCLSAERFLFEQMRDSYLGVGRPTAFSRDLCDEGRDDSVGVRGASRGGLA